MDYDKATKMLTLDNGSRVHHQVVEAVVGDVLEGHAVLLAPCTEAAKGGGYWYTTRTSTDEDGRPIVSRRHVPSERLVKRLGNLFLSWLRRSPPHAAKPDCGWPSCSCKPMSDGHVKCTPKDQIAVEMGLAHASDVIAPRCGACGCTLRVGDKAEENHVQDVYTARCSDPDCTWKAILVVTVQEIAPDPRLQDGEE